VGFYVILNEDWEAWISERFHGIPDAAAQAQAYRDRTSWAQVGGAGVDF